MNRDSGWVKGSWSTPGRPQSPSNVTRIARAIKNVDDSQHQQIVYYQAGVGTSFSGWENLLGGGTGQGLAENIREAYSFLATNYMEHDRSGTVSPDSVFLIGFSRGAYTARSIGGLIGAIGILRKEAMPFFYEIFQDWQNAGNPRYKPQFMDSYLAYLPQSSTLASPEPVGLDLLEEHLSRLKSLAPDRSQIAEYMRVYRQVLMRLGLTREATVSAIGVWDTVGALGVPVNPLIQALLPFLPAFISSYKWYDTTIGDHVKNAYHALALDERRYPYAPTLWERPEGCKTNLKQVWFPGAHANVGGGYPDQGIANLTLIWMMDQLAGHSATEYAHDLDTIAFDDQYVDNYNDLQVRQYLRSDNTSRGWWNGIIYDSLTFPQSLAGKLVRTPGRYCPTDFATGKPDNQRLLHDTNEYVHASVRAFQDLREVGIEPDWSQAFPYGWNIKPWFQLAWRKITGSSGKGYMPHRMALRGWQLQDGHTVHKTADHNPSASPGARVEWVAHEANKTGDGANVMYEDLLGRYELKFLNLIGETGSTGLAGKLQTHLDVRLKKRALSL